ncbi:ATPase [Pedobacter yonginense]|uniref:ATPase n=1 Tax=Pedobacter yonginense TaxID=651869 RepID=A0A317EJI8_9SPHI|nr:SRPBCC domain-containing protein [Pedobacter yonginense]PWS26485.1 ATPase [Pedobacter yonginense]
MSKPSFSTTFLVNHPAKEVFNAINNVRGWWQGEIEGSTNQLHDEFSYRSGEFHFSIQKIEELIPDQKVVWRVTESKINFVANKTEWVDTKISFEIKQIDNQTQLRFTHVGLVPDLECYGSCSNAWSKLINESLFSLITKGLGTQVFG